MLIPVKFVSLMIMLIYLSSCAIGRSWDSPSINEENKKINKDKNIIVYIENSNDIENNEFFIETDQQDSKRILLKEVKNQDTIQYPLLTVETDEPKYSDSLISYSSYISIFTFSIIPGYTNESSNIHLVLTYKNNNENLITQEKSYTATRHFISWLPLVLFANYGSDMANSWGTLKTGLYWDKAYEYYIRQFLSENIEHVMPKNNAQYNLKKMPNK